jgi:hypothetical protein
LYCVGAEALRRESGCAFLTPCRSSGASVASAPPTLCCTRDLHLSTPPTCALLLLLLLLRRRLLLLLLLLRLLLLLLLLLLLRLLLLRLLLRLLLLLGLPLIAGRQRRAGAAAWRAPSPKSSRASARTRRLTRPATCSASSSSRW